jgi:hypothetical protein
MGTNNKTENPIMEFTINVWGLAPGPAWEPKKKEIKEIFTKEYPILPPVSSILCSGGLEYRVIGVRLVDTVDGVEIILDVEVVPNPEQIPS